MTVSFAPAVRRHTDREKFRSSSSPVQKKERRKIPSLSQLTLPGILVLNRDGKIIYQNLGALNIQKALAENNPSYFSKIVAGFYAEMKKWMERHRPGVLNPFVSRVFSLNSRHYLFRALPLYSQRDPSDPKHLLILFEPIIDRIKQDEPPIRLTPRAKRVVRLLLERKDEQGSKQPA